MQELWRHYYGLPWLSALVVKKAVKLFIQAKVLTIKKCLSSYFLHNLAHAMER